MQHFEVRYASVSYQGIKERQIGLSMDQISLDKTLFDLAGRTALVTGGSRGIGKAIAARLAQHGANVAVLGRKTDAAQKAAEEINEAKGGSAIAVTGNVTRMNELLAAVDIAEQKLGPLDIVVANAGLHVEFGPSAQMTDAALEKTLDGNFRALHVLCQRVLPGMCERRWGRIINIGSIAAHFGTGVYHSYTLSKAIAMQYMRNIAVEHGETGIRANTVSPGLIRTDMAIGLIENPEELAKEMARSTVGRVGEPDEIAGVVVMLASAAGGYINGQTLAVDGGQTIKYVV